MYEYSNEDATKEQVRAAIRAAKVLMTRPLPLSGARPQVALVGFSERATGKYKLFREFRLFQTGKLLAQAPPPEGHDRLIALPILTREEYESVRPEDLPDYRVYESVGADGT